MDLHYAQFIVINIVMLYYYIILYIYTITSILQKCVHNHKRYIRTGHANNWSYEHAHILIVLSKILFPCDHSSGKIKTFDDTQTLWTCYSERASYDFYLTSNCWHIMDNRLFSSRRRILDGIRRHCK